MLPSDAKERKAVPMCTGVLDYFPDALAAVAEVSRVGNDQHNPGQPLHWDKSKSTDHADCLLRHLSERGLFDEDGQRHSAKVAWRALALLQTELDNEPKRDAPGTDILPWSPNSQYAPPGAGGIGTMSIETTEQGEELVFHPFDGPRA